MTEPREPTETIPPGEWAKMTPDERTAASAAWFEAQDARDGAGQLAAIEAGADLRRRIERGEITREQADAELDDELAHIGDEYLPRSPTERAQGERFG